MKTIPLQYSSGMVYGQMKLDCSVPMQVYFPIDAYTQTILLSVVGNNTQIQIYDAQNRPVAYDHFMHDTVSLWDLYEIRKRIYIYETKKNFQHVIPTGLQSASTVHTSVLSQRRGTTPRIIVPRVEAILWTICIMTNITSLPRAQTRTVSGLD